MCRKLLSKPFFVKTQSVSLDFVATLTRDSWEAVCWRELEPEPFNVMAVRRPHDKNTMSQFGDG